MRCFFRKLGVKTARNSRQMSPGDVKNEMATLILAASREFWVLAFPGTAVREGKGCAAGKQDQMMSASKLWDAEQSVSFL